MNQVLFITSEAFPLIKTGGLADVAGSLPPALLKMEQEVRLLLPAYPTVMDKISKHKVIATHSYYGLEVKLLETRLPGTQVVTWLVDCPAVYNRPGGPYTNAHGMQWDDNALRFTVLCHCAVDIALNQLGLNWQPDVVHCNDWQSGLVPALLSLHENHPATVFTIHNLAYQGNFSQQTFNDLHLPSQLWHIDGLEFYNQLSFMKAGLAYADKINAVSPNYAREILQPEFGYGLDGLLLSREKDVSGILNGIDQKLWNPGTDTLIEQKYNSRSLAKKVLNKTALQQELDLPVDENIPLIGSVGRLVQQKGLDLILSSMDELVKQPVQLVMLGTGETHYEIALAEWATSYPDKVKLIIGYNEALAHKIEAASDFYLMPSIFEPCGLNQLYSLRYATLPIVTNVGGLADTVTDATAENLANKTANGFIINDMTVDGLTDAILRAVELYANKSDLTQCQKTAMKFNSSWTASAEQYIDLYEQALASQK